MGAAMPPTLRRVDPVQAYSPAAFLEGVARGHGRVPGASAGAGSAKPGPADNPDARKAMREPRPRLEFGTPTFN